MKTTIRVMGNDYDCDHARTISELASLAPDKLKKNDKFCFYLTDEAYIVIKMCLSLRLKEAEGGINPVNKDSEIVKNAFSTAAQVGGIAGPLGLLMLGPVGIAIGAVALGAGGLFGYLGYSHIKDSKREENFRKYLDVNPKILIIYKKYAKLIDRFTGPNLVESERKTWKDMDNGMLLWLEYYKHKDIDADISRFDPLSPW